MLHPGVRLVLWGVASGYSQSLQSLPLVTVTLAAALLAAAIARSRFLRLLQRARWLLLALALIFCWGTPGVYVLPELGWLGPTFEGFWLGATHVARLFVVLALLAVLLETTSLEDLVAGLFGLLRPLVCLGFDRERIAVRLMLVLHYVERRPAKKLGDWLHPLHDAESEQPDTIPLVRRALATSDIGVLVALAAASVWVILA